MSTQDHTAVRQESARTAARPSLRWAVRRALLGLVLMLSVVMLGAWLLYASIDPDEAIAAGVSSSAVAAPR